MSKPIGTNAGFSAFANTSSQSFLAGNGFVSVDLGLSASPDEYLERPMVSRVPQFQTRTFIDPKTLGKMDRFREQVQETHEDNLEAGVEKNPIALKYNHVDWWANLVRRDAPYTGPRALVDAGAIIFARFQETEEERLKTELKLMAAFTDQVLRDHMSLEERNALRDQWYVRFNEDAVNAGVNFSIEVSQPQKDYWLSIWHSILLTGEEKHAAFVIQKLCQIDGEIAERLLCELEGGSDEWYQFATQVRELLKEETISFDVQLSEDIVNLLQEFDKTLQAENWLIANQLIVKIYAGIFASENWEMILFGIDQLSQIAASQQVSFSRHGKVIWGESFFKEKTPGLEQLKTALKQNKAQQEAITQYFQSSDRIEEFSKHLVKVFEKIQTKFLQESESLTGGERFRRIQILLEIFQVLVKLAGRDQLGMLGVNINEKIFDLKRALSEEDQSLKERLEEIDRFIINHSTGEYKEHQLMPPQSLLYLDKNKVTVHEDLQNRIYQKFISSELYQSGESAAKFCDDLSSWYEEIEAREISDVQKDFDTLYFIRGVNEIANILFNLKNGESLLKEWEYDEEILNHSQTENEQADEVQAPAVQKGSAKEIQASPFNFENLVEIPRQSIPEKHQHWIPPKEILNSRVLFPRYKKIVNECASLMQAGVKIPIRLFGPPGTGKSTIPEIIAAKQQLPLLRKANSKRTDPTDYEGSWTIQLIKPEDMTEDEREMFEEAKEMGVIGAFRKEGRLIPVFESGPLAIAIEHGYHFVADEINQAKPGLKAFLHNYIQPDEEVLLLGKHGEPRKVKVHERHQFWVTENGIGEEGRERHDEAMLRRFVSFYVGSWDEAEVAEFIGELYKKPDGSPYWDKKTIQLMSMMHVLFYHMSQGLDYKDPQTGQVHSYKKLGEAIGQEVLFTPRSLMRFCERLIDLGGGITSKNLSRAIRAEYVLPFGEAKGMAEDRVSDREMIWDQADAIFRKLLEEKGDSQARVGPWVIPTPTPEEISKNFLGGRALNLSDDFTWTEMALNVVYETLWNYKLGYGVLVIGDAGEGKTYLGKKIAQMQGLDDWSRNLSPDSDKTDLVGRLGIRPDGSIGHIPGPVYLGVKKGGVIRLDEVFVANGSLLEEIFNPLEDGDQALYVSSPYERVPKHSRTQHYWSTNPYWGDYDGRNEFSRALMSRFATIVLAGPGWTLAEEDRVKMLAKKNGLPQAHDPQSLKVQQDGQQTQALLNALLRYGPASSRKKKILNEAEAPDLKTSLNSIPNLNKGEEDNEIKFEIHSDWQDDFFGLPSSLVVNKEEKATYEVDENGERTPLSQATLNKIERLKNYLERRSQTNMLQATKTVYDIKYVYGGMHVTDLKDNTIYLNIVDVLRLSKKAALGVAKHEYGHAILDETHPFYLAFEEARLYFNVIADPKVNEFASSFSPIFREEIEQYCEEFGWVETPSVQHQEIFQKRLPHIQFAHAIIYGWRFGKIMPWIDDERVIAALKEALPILEPAFTLFPKHLGEYEKQVSRNKFFRILDEAWPIYQRLVEESAKEIAEQMKQGKSKEDIVREATEGSDGDGDEQKQNGDSQQSGQPQNGDSSQDGGKNEGRPQSQSNSALEQNQKNQSSSGNSEEMDERVREALEEINKHFADEFEPENPASRKKREGEIEDAKKEMEDKDKNQNQGGDKGSEKNQEGKESGDNGSQNQNGKQTGDENGQNANESGNNSGNDAQAQQGKDGSQNAGSEASQGGPEMPGDASGVKNQNGDSQGNETQGGQSDQGQSASGNGEGSVKPSSQQLSSAERSAIYREIGKIQKDRQDASPMAKYTPPKAKEKVRLLRRLFPKEEYQNLEGHYYTGSALDPKRAVHDLVQPVPTGRIFQQRTAPGDIDVGFIELKDASGSTDNKEAIQASLETTATSIYMGKELGIDHGGIIFSDNYKWVNKLDQRLGNELRQNAVMREVEAIYRNQDPEFKRGSTNIVGPYAVAIAALAQKKYQLKYIVLITDGEHNKTLQDDPRIPDVLKGKSLSELRQIGIEHGIHPIVIGVGSSAKRSIPKIFAEHEYRLVEGFSDVAEEYVDIIEEIYRRRLHLKNKPKRMKGLK